MTTENLIIFTLLLVVILPLSIMGLIVASAIVAQNWRFIIYLTVLFTTTAVVAAACHALRSN